MTVSDRTPGVSPSIERGEPVEANGSGLGRDVESNNEGTSDDDEEADGTDREHVDASDPRQHSDRCDDQDEGKRSDEQESAE